jgi:hypothetical protein
MASNSAKAYIYGSKEKQRLVGAKKKKAFITDRLTAKSAKTYVYGYKEQKRLAAVRDMNVYVDECMAFVPPVTEPEPLTITTASNSCFLTFAF